MMVLRASDPAFGNGLCAPDGRASAGPSSAVVAQGPMPEWNLADLYPGIESEALKRDMAKAIADAAGFKARYQGKLTNLAAHGADLAACDERQLYAGARLLNGKPNARPRR